MTCPTCGCTPPADVAKRIEGDRVREQIRFLTLYAKREALVERIQSGLGEAS